MIDVGYKLVILLKSRDGMAPSEFTDAWTRLDQPDPVSPAGLLRYAFDAPITGASPVENAPTAPFDAAVETWWDRKNSAADWVVSHAFESWLNQRLELLAGRPTGFGGIPQVIWESDEPIPTGAVKVLILPVAARRLRFAEFADHWTGEHARLALGGPHTKERLLRLEDTPAPAPATSRLERGRYDGVGAITFASLEALTAEFGSDYYRSTLAPDELKFTNPAASAALLTREITEAGRS
ncbi:MAG: EthD domain-containing protein [Microbacterium sp.]